MRAAFCSGLRSVELRELETPAPQPGEVLVRVRSCGICGSDLHWFHGAFPPPPVCPGHEIAGAVAALGPGVEGLAIGQSVAVEPLVVCRRCPFCRTGDYQLCPRMRLLGTSRDGGFADALVMPADALYALPPDLEPAVGALAEPLAVGVHGVRLGGVRLGDRVLVLGAGTIGLLSVLAARAAGAAEVAITARHPHQAEAARRLGATRAFATDAEGARGLSAWSAGAPVDVVLETVGGSADTLGAAVDAVRRGGTVVVLGVFTAAPRCPALALVVKEVRMVGSLTYGRAGTRADFDVAIDLLCAHREVAAGLITHRFGLDELQRGLEAASDKSRGAIKVTIAP